MKESPDVGPKPGVTQQHQVSITRGKVAELRHRMRAIDNFMGHRVNPEARLTDSVHSM